jgi:hypothetical protein
MTVRLELQQSDIVRVIGQTPFAVDHEFAINAVRYSFNPPNSHIYEFELASVPIAHGFDVTCGESDIEFSITIGNTGGYFYLPIHGQNIVVDWGDGSRHTIRGYRNSSYPRHLYREGSYNLRLRGAIEWMSFENTRSSRHVMEVRRLDISPECNVRGAFVGCPFVTFNRSITDAEIEDTASVPIVTDIDVDNSGRIVPRVRDFILNPRLRQSTDESIDVPTKEKNQKVDKRQRRKYD